ncbi:hypothetical protein AB44_4468 [Escherichia coli 3-073-06_S1_C2]|nr:hypothetical protein [Escherichia coli]KDZ57608.1 hypothetical protein AB44_4468 [Escherichia coli 3-073-06_S1_C2]KGM64426.1 hypothetical protein EL75_4701 [Escherichia coli]KGM76418.1 hypothetical protein EL80_5041 [Escherichia coli]KGM77518.1 hypothetical protein EL79_5162 [Escherichia coli]MCI3485805.1 hypothetical protein [Escherichia coli]
MRNGIFTGNNTARIPGTRPLFYGYGHHVKSESNNDLKGNGMSNEYQSTSINPDVFEQFLTLLNTHCQSSEESLAMLSTLCFDLMMKCGIQSMDSLMLNGMGISMQLQGIDNHNCTTWNIH